MASSASGQDEPNRALWLATRAGKMEPSYPLGTTRCIPQAKFPQKPYDKSFIGQVCSVKMAGYWPRSFFASLWTSTSSRSINTQKKKELGQYPAILTSHLVNNPYILHMLKQIINWCAPWYDWKDPTDGQRKLAADANCSSVLPVFLLSLFFYPFIETLPASPLCEV